MVFVGDGRSSVVPLVPLAVQHDRSTCSLTGCDFFWLRRLHLAFGLGLPWAPQVESNFLLAVVLLFIATHWIDGVPQGGMENIWVRITIVQKSALWCFEDG